MRASALGFNVKNKNKNKQNPKPGHPGSNNGRYLRRARENFPRPSQDRWLRSIHTGPAPSLWGSVSESSPFQTKLFCRTERKGMPSHETFNCSRTTAGLGKRRLKDSTLGWQRSQNTTLPSVPLTSRKPHWAEAETPCLWAETHRNG